MGPTAALEELRGSIVRTSLADSVYETLLEGIVTGRLPCGMELSEVALAEQLEVSRTPIHDALRRLAYDGLVEQALNRKSRVAQFDESDIREVYELREVLEARAAELAADRLSQDQLADLQRVADQLSTDVGADDWPERAIEFDLRFHEVLAAGCGNGRLKRDILRYRRLVRGFCRLSGSRDNLRHALAEHVEVLKELQRRDAGGARDAMARHISTRLAAVLAQLQSGRNAQGG